MIWGFELNSLVIDKEFKFDYSLWSRCRRYVLLSIVYIVQLHVPKGDNSLSVVVNLTDAGCLIFE